MDHYDDEEVLDEELLYLMHCGNELAKRCLCERYYEKITYWVNPLSAYQYLGIDREDLIQVGMMCFLKALEDYRNDLNTSLYTYVRTVVVRRLYTYIKQPKERRLYENYAMFSLDEVTYNDDSLNYNEVIPDTKDDYQPTKQFVIKETQAEYMSYINEKASPIEMAVIQDVYYGYTQKEIAKRLDISLKSVYNAIYRCHQKCLPLTEKGKYDKL